MDDRFDWDEFNSPDILSFRAELKASLGPNQVANRAGTMLGIVTLAVEEMAGLDITRVMHAFLDVVVFGRSMTLVMQHLRTWDRSGFNEWYAPWEATMATDPLFQFFNGLRVKVIHGYTPEIGVALAVQGRSDLRPGQVTVIDYPLPETHLGKPIEDKSTLNLSRLYQQHLDGMFTSFAPLVWVVQDRVTAEYRAKLAAEGR
jgi:hypothetical protein